jgi:hypothetical protein
MLYILPLQPLYSCIGTLKLVWSMVHRCMDKRAPYKSSINTILHTYGEIH